MRGRVQLALVLALAALLPLIVAGCRQDPKGRAAVSVQTTLPEGTEVTLVSTERVGTYADRAVTDVGGRLQFVGIRPGRYKMVFQFSRSSHIPSDPAYNYGETEPFEVTPGLNRLEWTAGTNEVTRTE